MINATDTALLFNLMLLQVVASAHLAELRFNLASLRNVSNSVSAALQFNCHMNNQNFVVS